MPPPPVTNLIKQEWTELDSDELRVLLDDRLGGPGQISGAEGDQRLFLPLYGPTCRLILHFDDTEIRCVEAGPAFDGEQWTQVSSAIETLLSTPPDKIGRDFAFARRRVTGTWRGAGSGVQILPNPPDAPTCPTGTGSHPFVLEFPIHSDTHFSVTNARRRRQHRKIVQLLNVLLFGGAHGEDRMSEHRWVWLNPATPASHSEWVQLSYMADLGQVVIDAHSEPTAGPMETLAPDAYYAQLGDDGSPLRVPTDLDESICRYLALPRAQRRRFDRALFWLDVSARQWTMSMSSSFTSLVSAVETLTERGSRHHITCPKCERGIDHEVPGPTARFRSFFETYAPGASQKKRRDEMYELRSDISHGSRLIAFDEGRAFGWDPPWNNQRKIQDELWTLARAVMRGYLRSANTPAN